MLYKEVIEFVLDLINCFNWKIVIGFFLLVLWVSKCCVLVRVFFINGWLEGDGLLFSRWN